MIITIIRRIKCSKFLFEDSFMQYPLKMKTTRGSNSRPAKYSTPTDVSVPIAYKINRVYTGGRQKTALRLRTLVKAWNGRLSNHDCGLEWSLGELVSAAGKTDAVVFPADCIGLSAFKNTTNLQETPE